jgi:hypothetical protein
MSVSSAQVVQYLFQVGGTLLTTIGAVIVLYSDIPYPRVKAYLRKLAPKAEVLRSAQQSFDEHGRIRDEEEVTETERIFEARYGRSNDKTPEKVQETSTSIRIEYEDGSRVDNGFRDREPGRVEKRMFFDWGIRRYYTQVGMKYIFFGFLGLFIGTLMSPLTWIPA